MPILQPGNQRYGGRTPSPSARNTNTRFSSGVAGSPSRVSQDDAKVAELRKREDFFAKRRRQEEEDAMLARKLLEEEEEVEERKKISGQSVPGGWPVDDT